MRFQYFRLAPKVPQTADGVLPLLGSIRQGAEGGGKGTASPFHILQGRAKLLRMGQGVRQPDQSLPQLRQGRRCLGKAALNAGQCRIPRLPLLLGHPLRAAGVPQNAQRLCGGSGRSAAVLRKDTEGFKKRLHGRAGVLSSTQNLFQVVQSGLKLIS